MPTFAAPASTAARGAPLLANGEGDGRWKCSATFQRVLGLTIKASLLSAQRVFDILALVRIVYKVSPTWLAVVKNGNFWLLVSGAFASTVLSALTLSRHRSAIRQNRPYGWYLAVLVSALQLAPLVEMVDKMGDGFCWGVSDDDFVSPLASVMSTAASPELSRRRAQAEIKGSRYGENLMRGLRKLSIASLPLVLLSAIVHSAWLLRSVLGKEAFDGSCVQEAVALGVGIICLAMACADVVLYVWVDDAFVRTHKKLVQVHYFLELLTRLPLCLLLHVSFMLQPSAMQPIVFLWAGDCLASVLLLLSPTLGGWRRRMSCRHGASQVASAVTMSQILFLVNITFFDPREAFQVVNAGFYIVKYLEAFVICKILQWHGILEPFFQHFCEAQLAAVLLNAFLVWVVVPKLRTLQVNGATATDMPRLSRLLPRAEDEEAPRSRSQVFGAPEALELSTVGSPQNVWRHWRGGPSRAESARLDLLGDMLEGLCLLSQAHSERNRPAVARSTVADVLWSLVLPWDGDYEDGLGGKVALEVIDSEKGTVLVRWTKAHAEAAIETLGVMFQGTAIEVVLDPSEGRVTGSFSGKDIRFSDAHGTVWTRQSDSQRALASTAARELLRLVLTQVLLALRWEPTFLGLGTAAARAGKLLVADAAQRPLLSFLIRYAIGTHDLTLLSEIYWALWCLSQDVLDPDRTAYEKARWVLIKSLEGTIEFWDGVRGIRLDHLCTDPAELNAFRHEALRVLTSQAFEWRRAGDTAEKTRAVRHRLREMKSGEAHPRFANGSLDLPEDSYMLDVLKADPELKAATLSASLVGSTARLFLSVDPSVAFLGLDINACEILASNTAPLLLGCVKANAADPEAESGSQVDKYMVKVGDDLRQDQLVLQMLHLMELVWQERLPETEHRMLRFVPYLVLAMTPNAGYIKFVPGAVSLSKALAQANGDLRLWLSAHRPNDLAMDQVLANLCGSAAAYCVATYARLSEGPAFRRAHLWASAEGVWPKPGTCAQTGLKMYYPLDLASAMPVLALLSAVKASASAPATPAAPAPANPVTLRAVDACSAPGGKLLVMAGALLHKGPGLITAVEQDAFRLSRLKQNLRLYLPKEAKRNLEVVRGDFAQLARTLRHSPFDAALVDAPCSSERERLLRALRRNSGSEAWRAEKAQANARRQIALLRAAVSNTIPGGTVVYATCALSRVENDAVVEAVLAEGRCSVSGDADASEFDGLDVEKTSHGWRMLPDTQGWGPLYWSVLRSGR
ncbi:unnamed protein product [Effrenium voratum]|nr:unnamed protein product [Effrenium voratum]